MDIEDIYGEAMHASVSNAEQWLKDARILLTNKSHTHARALQNFAGEECAKALGCWFVSVGILPSDHPEVEIRGRKSVFKSHNLKNKLSLLLGALSILPEINAGTVLGVLVVAEATGKLGTEKRMEWMYVDIVKSGDGYRVSNPLKIDTGDVHAGLNLVERKIEFLKRFINSVDEETIEILKQRLVSFFTNE